MKNLNLNKYFGGEFTDSLPYVLDGNAIEIKMNTPLTDCTYMAIARADDKRHKIPVNDGVFSVPSPSDDCTLELAILAFKNGNTVASWTCEPLELVSVEGVLNVIPALSRQKRMIKALEDAVNNLTAANDHLTNRIELLEGELTEAKMVADNATLRSYLADCAIMRYIYRHYKADVIGNEKDLNAEDFCKAIGYSPLTAGKDFEDFDNFAKKENVL